jgi:hypothetical protein
LTGGLGFSRQGKTLSSRKTGNCSQAAYAQRQAIYYSKPDTTQAHPRLYTTTGLEKAKRQKCPETEPVDMDSLSYYYTSLPDYPFISILPSSPSTFPCIFLLHLHCYLVQAVSRKFTYTN